MTSSISMEVISDKRRLNFLLEQLENFLKVRPQYSFCLTTDWLEHWLKMFLQPRDQLFVHVFFSENELVGCIPVYIKRSVLDKTLMLIGTGEDESEEVCSEFLDFVIVPRFEVDCFRMFSLSVRQRVEIDKINFKKVLSESLAVKWLKASGTKYWNPIECYEFKKFLIPIEKDDISQLEKFPSETIRRRARRFLDRKDITIRVCNEQSSFKSYFDILIDLHTERWAHKGRLGVFKNNKFKNFHKSFAQTRLASKGVLLFELYAGGNVEAVFYGICHNETLFYYQSGITTNGKVGSAGVAMHIIAMKLAREYGYKYYDMLSGLETSYKKGFIQPVGKVYDFQLVKKCKSYRAFLKRILVKVVKRILQ